VTFRHRFRWSIGRIRDHSTGDSLQWRCGKRSIPGEFNVPGMNRRRKEKRKKNQGNQPGMSVHSRNQSSYFATELSTEVHGKKCHELTRIARIREIRGPCSRSGPDEGFLDYFLRLTTVRIDLHMRRRCTMLYPSKISEQFLSQFAIDRMSIFVVLQHEIA